MKPLLILVLALCFDSYQLLGQGDGKGVKYQFAKDVFKTEYKRQDFRRFNGKIDRINENALRFGDKVLTLYLEDKSLINIFLKGIFYPDIIGGKETTRALTKAELDTMSTNSRVFYNLTRNDSLWIGSLEELDKLNPNYKTKRFKFWLSGIGMVNPTECYFELYNGNATKHMSTEAFIENAKLTFYYRGTVIL